MAGLSSASINVKDYQMPKGCTAFYKVYNTMRKDFSPLERFPFGTVGKQYITKLSTINVCLYIFDWLDDVALQQKLSQVLTEASLK